MKTWKFPGGPVVWTWHFHWHGPGQGTKILQAAWHGPKINKYNFLSDKKWGQFYFLLSNLLPSVFPSIRVFSNESALLIRRPKYWSFSFSISPSNEYSGSISFRIDWFDLLAVQGTLQSLFQHCTLKASIKFCQILLLHLFR